MKKREPKKKAYLCRQAKLKHEKYIRRKPKQFKQFKGWLKFMADVHKKAKENHHKAINSSFSSFSAKRKLGPKPEYSDTIKYLAKKREAFSEDIKPIKENGHFLLPEIFSLTENYSISFSFLKRLFFALYHQSTSHIELDYSKCQRIDIDASLCMDILLGEFILHFKQCRKKGHPVHIVDISPTNFEKPDIAKVLFSIGAFSSIKGFRINYNDIIPYPLSFGIINHTQASKIREIHITQMVDYVLRCMSKMKRTLTAEAEDDLFKVIGEVLINAEEHSSGDKRFSIGYFQDTEENGEHIGTFNLVILNFGNSIYEKFSDPECPNSQIVNEMKDLSGKFTKEGLFSKAEFEEQTLWTLYALQEGVTSKADWKRGNGSIRFIDSFFSLKGDNEKDNTSYLSIVSGNTRITFDGTYRLIDKFKGKNNRKFKMMTFNRNGDIKQKPDKKYVNFVKNYFPGTIISAKICIKETNSEQASNEYS